MLLRMGLPSDIAPDKVHPIVCCIFMAPIVVMEVKIYGQWFTRGKRSLARIANPSTYLSVIGNFVVARLATRVDWNEIAMFFFIVGLVHYAIVFITLYQRFSPDITVSRKITPLFFLFIAGPSSASVTWQAISGSFDTIGRINFFRDTMRNFLVILWACAYPMTITSVATIKYAEEVRHPIARSLALVLCWASIGMVFFLTVFTAMDLILDRNHLFPDDTVINICTKQTTKASPMTK
ncbi:hypothetical protein SUGI_0079460 [Cryptomeria japonica]|nr:hypothetical protein SUGI_0079460 [Cryptomeria japonica]